MCFSCPPSAYCCYACGTNHRTPASTPVLAPAPGAMLVPRGSLATMPRELIMNILSFTPPGSDIVFGVVSRAFQRLIDFSAHLNVTTVFAYQYSRENSLLCKYVRELEADYQKNHRWAAHSGPSSSSEGEPAASPFGCTQTDCHLAVNVNGLIVRRIRLLGIACPNTLLSFREVAGFSEETQTLQDASLERMWRGSWGLQMQTSYSLSLNSNIRSGRCSEDSHAEKIRTWMAAHALLLQDVPALGDQTGKGLTCLPIEMRLYTGLQHLGLSFNLLTFLSPDLFQGFPGLYRIERIALDNNQLHSLPRSLFRGLNRLTFLSLSYNQLSTLPDDLFNGLSTLERLSLSGNRLRSLSQGLFAGLNCLRDLKLDCNLLVSLPAGLFCGLTRLQLLNLFQNQLNFIPENCFAGLTGLKNLYLCHNQLSTFSPRLFQGLPQLDDFYLFDNPRLLAADFPAAEYSPGFRRGRHLNNLEFQSFLDDFFSYRCQSALAKMYQLAAAGSCRVEIEESFSSLDDSTRNAIVEKVRKVRVEAGGSDHENHRSGEHPVFDDMQIFNIALKRYVMERFNALSHEQKNAVNIHVQRLVPPGYINCNDPLRRELYANGNILWMIDAMIQLQS